MEDGAKPRDLEDQAFRFAESVRAFVKQLPRTVSNTQNVRQLVRASGSVAVKICCKEAKESRLFLRLVDAGLTKDTIVGRDKLATEGGELLLIFSSIISKSE